MSLTSINSLKISLGEALQPILHFFARMSAQPLSTRPGMPIYTVMESLISPPACSIAS